MAGGRWAARRNEHLPPARPAPTNTHCTHPRCGRELAPERVGVYRYCDDCRDANRDKRRKQANRHKADAGGCDRCGGRLATDVFGPWRAPGVALCGECFFKDRSKTHFRTKRHWRSLAERFLLQQGRCALTGVPLRFGENASLDHRVPLQKGGGATLKNVWWVTRTANMVKSDQTLEELRGILARMLAYLDSPEHRDMARRLDLAADHGGPAAG